MKFISLFCILIITYSCENLRHATNINASEMENITKDWEYTKELDEKVKVRNSSEVKSCQFVAHLNAKDNIIEPGKKVVVYYLKHYALRKEANVIVIDELEKVGDYGHRGSAKAYQCSR